MEFLSAVHTDKGIKKNTNQDSVLIKEAITDHGKVFFAAVCDGMGGLAKGEVASATLVRAFSDWFENRFPVFLYEKRTADGIDRIEMENDLNRLILDVNSRISAYGQQFHAALGTTAAMILFAEGRYYILNIGDSRVYRLKGQTISRLTKDQTYVQKEIDMGRMTPEEAKAHPQRNVLLQCIGASEVIIPEFEHGTYGPEEVYMICSDGFRHVIAEEEFVKLMAPDKIKEEKDLQNAAVYFTELNKSRQEKDNISVILLKTC